jgi:hypothetical protein
VRQPLARPWRRALPALPRLASRPRKGENWSGKRDSTDDDDDVADDDDAAALAPWPSRA